MRGQSLTAELTKVLKTKNKDDILKTLKCFASEIWQLGINDECVDYLVDLFISSDLDNPSIKLILSSIIPQTVISSNTVEQLILWLFSKAITAPENVETLISWLTKMVTYKLVDKTPLEQNYGFLLKYLKYLELVKPLCNLLILITKRNMVNKNNVFLVTEFYKEHLLHQDIGRLLLLYDSMCPNLVKFKPKSKQNFDSKDKKKLSDFEEVLRNAALKQGITTTEKPEFKGSHGSLLIPDYESLEETINQTNDLNKITTINSMNELGKRFSSIILPNNELNLLTTNEGVMYIVANGPSQDFLYSLNLELKKNPSEALLISLVGLQEQLMHGLPPVTNYLIDFLITWDGVKQEQIVYSLIPWIHFNTLTELKKHILTPLARIFVSSCVETKIQIIGAITCLITNMMSVHMERFSEGLTPPGLENPKWLRKPTDTVVGLCELVSSLLNTGVTLDGMACTSLINQALSFYLKITYLQVEFCVVCFIVVPPVIAYSALFSMNHATLSQLCLLITRYKQAVMPLLSSCGVLDQFITERENVANIATNIFTYLWKNKDGEEILSEVASSQEELNAITVTIGRRHIGMFPLISHLAGLLKRDPDELDKEAVLHILEGYAEGIAEFIKWQTEEDESQSSEFM